MDDRIARLALVDWPEGEGVPRFQELSPPALNERAVLLVRRVSVVAGPGDVPAAVVAEVQAGAARAVRPDRGRLAPDVEAVLFEDESEMLACYLVALSVRALDDHWCWPLLRPALPTPSLGAVVGDPATPVLGVLARLTEWSWLEEVVGGVDRATQWRVLAALAERHALWLREAGAGGPRTPRLPVGADPEDRAGAGAEPITTAGETRVVPGGPPGSSPWADSAAQSLASPVSTATAPGPERGAGSHGSPGGWEIGREGSHRVLWRLAPEEQISGGLTRLVETLLGRRFTQSAPDWAAHRRDRGWVQLQAPSPSLRARPDGAESLSPRPPDLPRPGRASSRTGSTATTCREPSVEAELDLESPLTAPRALTDLGGVLYLVNLLRRFDVVECGLGDVDPWDVVDGLARAALSWSQLSSSGSAGETGATPGDEYRRDDPIWDVLAGLAGRSPGEASDLEAVQRCADALRRLEPALAFTADEPGWRTLLAVRGRVVVDTTHVELFTTSDQVHLSVRRRALDSDPGWVPVLGRVVLFHFDGHQP